MTGLFAITMTKAALPCHAAYLFTTTLNASSSLIGPSLTSSKISICHNAYMLSKITEFDKGTRLDSTK
jgi:hypothetical protein